MRKFSCLNDTIGHEYCATSLERAVCILCAIRAISTSPEISDRYQAATKDRGAYRSYCCSSFLVVLLGCRVAAQGRDDLCDKILPEHGNGGPAVETGRRAIQPEPRSPWVRNAGEHVLYARNGPAIDELGHGKDMFAAPHPQCDDLIVPPPQVECRSGYTKLFFQIRLPHDLPSPVFDQHRFKVVFLIRQVLERVTCDWGGGGM